MAKNQITKNGKNKITKNGKKSDYKKWQKNQITRNGKKSNYKKWQKIKLQKMAKTQITKNGKNSNYKKWQKTQITKNGKKSNYKNGKKLNYKKKMWKGIKLQKTQITKNQITKNQITKMAKNQITKKMWDQITKNCQIIINLPISKYTKNEIWRTCDMFVLFAHERHSKVLFRKLAIHINPHKLHTWTLKNYSSNQNFKKIWVINVIWPSWWNYLYGSETSNNLSRKNCDAPWAIWQSRSISPNRKPPSRDRPSIGCRFSNCNGPRARL